jgi:hypothetical protein
MPYEEEQDLTPGERELEAALSGLTPAAPSFTFQRIQTRALLNRERRRTRLWQAVAALLAMAAGVGFTIKPAPRIVQVERQVERIVLRDRQKPAENQFISDDAPPATLAPQPIGDYAYLRLRQRVLTNGVASLRATRSAQAPRPAELTAGRATPIEMPTLVDYVFSGGRS